MVPASVLRIGGGVSAKPAKWNPIQAPPFSMYSRKAARWAGALGRASRKSTTWQCETLLPSTSGRQASEVSDGSPSPQPAPAAKARHQGLGLEEASQADEAAGEEIAVT